MQPRRHGRPAGRDRAVLSALPGHRYGKRKAPADLRLPARIARPHRHPGTGAAEGAHAGGRPAGIRRTGVVTVSAEQNQIAGDLATASVEARRSDFPILFQDVNGQPLTYLDSAASSQRPLPVIEAVEHYEKHDHANVHRGVHTLSHRATEAYEGAREKVRRFINAAGTSEIVFTRGTTEAINLVASSWAAENVGAGDEILITWLEHHANIVPWQMLCERTGAVLRVAPIDDAGAVDLEALEALIGERTKLIAFSHTSNALGTITPAREIIALARERGIVTLVDGAQAVPHGPVDVQELGCDFFAFSGHKMYAPTGIGVKIGRASCRERCLRGRGAAT